jgi:hydrogenase nickel incorporation protein HypB
MCRDCGCGLPGENPVKISAHHSDEHGHDHGHLHDHEEHHHHEQEHHHHDDAHVHSHGHEQEHHHQPLHESGDGRRSVEVRQAILARNDRLAERNRGFFHGRGLLVLNVLSSPGSGKTTFLRETIRSLGPKLKAGVIVGDLATDNDARRLRESGAPVVQITTGTVCHLEAEMISRAVSQLDLNGIELLIIENVGNLVCPASYDLGEDFRVVLLSVTEGEDKPLKYPPMFQGADVVIISKMDLAGPCGCDREALLGNLRRVSPRARVFETSARTGQGMDSWCEFLLGKQQSAKGRNSLAD